MVIADFATLDTPLANVVSFRLAPTMPFMVLSSLTFIHSHMAVLLTAYSLIVFAIYIDIYMDKVDVLTSLVQLARAVKQSFRTSSTPVTQETSHEG